MKTLSAKQLKRFQACVALLDAVKPGWRHKINLYTLDMGKFDQCILGQIFGDYDKYRHRFWQLYVLRFPKASSTNWPFNPKSWSKNSAYAVAWRQEVERYL